MRDEEFQVGQGKRGEPIAEVVTYSNIIDIPRQIRNTQLAIRYSINMLYRRSEPFALKEA